MISTLAVDLSRKAMSISARFTATSTRNNHGESREDVTLSSFTQPASGSQVTPVTVRLESAVRAMAEGMYYTFRLSFAVEVNQLVSSRSVFQQDVAPRAGT